MKKKKKRKGRKGRNTSNFSKRGGLQSQWKKKNKKPKDQKLHARAVEKLKTTTVPSQVSKAGKRGVILESQARTEKRAGGLQPE